jgi:SAM-dependent methyltransferase
LNLERYYRAQIEAHSDQVLRDEASRAHAETWFSSDTTDYWRHDRMRQSVIPVLNPGDHWVTFGDGRFGTDAAWLTGRGQRVLCTDVQDSLLKMAKDRGFISEYREANAEALPFADNEFDWGLCKEAYHHMPRPPVAFYEMLRVVKKGLVLIEPGPRQARNLIGSFLVPLLNLIHPIRVENEFEVSGNYIFKLSIWDVRQMLTAIGLPCFAYRSMNDCYIEGVERESPPGKLQAACRRKIFMRDLIFKMIGLHGNLMVYTIFKERPAAPEEIARAGFAFVELPKNPYLTDAP